MADCLAWLFAVTDQTISDEEDIPTDKSLIIGHDYVGIQLLDRRHNSLITGYTPPNQELFAYSGFISIAHHLCVTFLRIFLHHFM